MGVIGNMRCHFRVFPRIFTEFLGRKGGASLPFSGVLESCNCITKSLMRFRGRLGVPEDYQRVSYALQRVLGAFRGFRRVPGRITKRKEVSRRWVHFRVRLNIPEPFNAAFR